MNAQSSLQTRLNDLITFIQGAIDTAHSGKNPNLGDMDMRVAQLCSDIQRAQPSEAKPLQPLMARMISALDELEQLVKDLRNNVQGS